MIHLLDMSLSLEKKETSQNATGSGRGNGPQDWTLLHKV